MNILLAASEGTPFVKSGGLADVIGSLSHALCQQGQDCRVILPLYESVGENHRKNMKFITSFNVPLSWRNQYCGLFETKANGVTYYFLDNEYYFKRKDLYGYFDDGERFAFYTKAILEMFEYIDFVPDVIHANDWQTGLVPVFLNTFYRESDKLGLTRTVFTIHNIQYQGKFSPDIAADLLGLPIDSVSKVEYDDCVNYMKGGMQEADWITTVSEEYAHEILDKWFSFGLDPYLRQRQHKLSGIVNGISYQEFNPKTDKALFQNYTVYTLAGRATCKRKLQEMLGLEPRPEAMLVGMVSRLVEPKGLALVQQAFSRMMERDIQFVLLGSGDLEYENYFREMQQQYPGRVSATIGFDESLSRKAYAGTDAFLMPSKSEPCGLSQLIALRYGSIPIVRLTGGLKDTIHDFGEQRDDSNGYTFYAFDAWDMLGAVLRADDAFQDQELWKKQIRKAMLCDFSWDRSSQKYIALYQQITS